MAENEDPFDVDILSAQQIVQVHLILLTGPT
jgi:hypothetical protein